MQIQTSMYPSWKNSGSCSDGGLESCLYYVGGLPHDVWLHVFSFLDPTSVSNCILVYQSRIQLGLHSEASTSSINQTRSAENGKIGRAHV